METRQIKLNDTEEMLVRDICSYIQRTAAGHPDAKNELQKLKERKNADDIVKSALKLLRCALNRIGIDHLDKLMDIFDSYLEEVLLDVFSSDSDLLPNIRSKILEVAIKTYAKESVTIYDNIVESSHAWPLLKEASFLNAFTTAIEKQEVLTGLLQAAIKMENPMPLQIIQTQERFKEFFDTWQKSLDAAQSQKLHMLINCKNPERYIDIVTRQFGKECGYVEYDGALVTCAQVKSRKKYFYQPTILMKGEFKEYIEFLKTAPCPINEKFICTGKHWICGQISVDDAGKVDVLFLDSTGRSDESDSAIKLVHEVFADSHLGIYIDNTKTQHTILGCQVFALDNTVHLATVGNYLDAKYSTIEVGKRIFSYVKEKEHIKHQKVLFKTIPINIVEIPLPLLRTAQTLQLIEEPNGKRKGFITSRSKEEQELPVNKKRLTAMESAKIHIYPDTDPYRKGKMTNFRLLYKFRKMQTQNALFLVETSPQNVHSSMQTFTLSGMKTRFARFENARRSVDGLTLTMVAAEYNHPELMQKLMDSKADLNKANKNGWTALMFAAECNAANMITALVEGKSALDTTNNDSWTAAIIAACHDHAKATEALITAKADFNKPNKDNWTPAMLAAKHGHENIIRILAKHEAKVNFNAVNNDGWTATMIAVERGHIKVIQTLADAKADFTIATKEGITAEMIATKAGHHHIARFIKSSNNAKKDSEISNLESAMSSLSLKSKHAAS